MWIGTSAGLYLLDKESGRFQYVALQEETTYINTLYQAGRPLSIYRNKRLRVVVYNAKDSTFKHYHKDNCALISNNIYTILPESDGHILMSTENGISCFHLRRRHSTTGLKSRADVLLLQCLFRNATQEQGVCLWQHRRSHPPEGTRLPKDIYSPMILSDFQILYQTVFPAVRIPP